MRFFLVFLIRVWGSREEIGYRERCREKSGGGSIMVGVRF